MRAFETDSYSLGKLNWEQGSIDAATGSFSGNSYRIRAKITAQNITKISVTSGAFFTIFAFSGNTYIGEWSGNGFQKTAIRITDDFDATVLAEYEYTYWIMLGYIASATIAPSDGTLLQIYCGKLTVLDDIISYSLLDTDSEEWTQGGYNVETGADLQASYRIKRRLKKEVVSISAADNCFFSIFAYNGDTFVGVWNGSTFEKAACRLKGKYYLPKLHNYNYELRVMCGFDDNSSMTPEDGASEIAIAVDNVGTIRSNLFPQEQTPWWQRSINISTGEQSPSSFRLIARLNRASTVVKVPDNMFFTVFAYSGDTYIGVWNKTTFEKTACRLKGTQDITGLRKFSYAYWIMLGYDNNADTSISDGDKVSIKIDWIKTQSESNKFTFSASPNIIYQCRNVDDARIPPESKWSVKAAAENQYDRVRCTVRVTTGGEYFLCHNPTINEYVLNLDGSALEEEVSAEERTLAELNAYDWGLKYGEEYAGATVPLLEEFLKYASIFNLGVTWHAGSASAQTNSAIDEQLTLIDKYGLTDNLIVVSSGQNLSALQRFVAHNPRISCYVGGLPEYFEDQTILATINSLQTSYNKIYVQLFPWGTAPTDAFIALAKTKNWLLYDSITMNENQLCNEDMFAKGYSLREVNNVYMVKDTVRRWANTLF